jgi:hypothetical protein
MHHLELYMQLKALQTVLHNITKNSWKLLESFSEMDTLTNRGFLPAISTVCCVLFL